jgi:TPR repeat protein
MRSQLLHFVLLLNMFCLSSSLKASQVEEDPLGLHNRKGSPTYFVPSVEDQLDSYYMQGLTNYKCHSYEEAFNDFTKVVELARQNNLEHLQAKYNLGVLYERGLGVEQSLIKAINCYTEAYSAGYSKAENAIKIATSKMLRHKN